MPRQHSVKTEALSKTETDDNPLMDMCAYPSTSSVQDARGLMSSARIEARPQKQEHVLMTEQINDMQRQRTFNEQFDSFFVVLSR